jgi:hypothetical protein
MARRTVTGRWRIVEMELWDREAMGLVEPAMIEFARDGTGSFHFIVVQAGLDYRVSDHDRRRVEFSWEGFDEGTPVTGRGWASVEDDGTLSGRIYFRMGDDSAFSAVRAADICAPTRLVVAVSREITQPRKMCLPDAVIGSDVSAAALVSSGPGIPGLRKRELARCTSAQGRVPRRRHSRAPRPSASAEWAAGSDRRTG